MVDEPTLVDYIMTGQVLPEGHSGVSYLDELRAVLDGAKDWLRGELDAKAGRVENWDDATAARMLSAKAVELADAAGASKNFLRAAQYRLIAVALSMDAHWRDQLAEPKARGNQIPINI